MTACPYCFADLSTQRVAYRCTSGRCPEAIDYEASSQAGFQILSTTPLILDASSRHAFPTSVPCISCNATCTQEVCIECLRDIPAGWRDGETLTLAVTGAVGVGKSVWIGVLVNQLQRFAAARQVGFSAFNNSTKETYEANYQRPMYDSNGVLRPTPPLSDNEAYQREPLIWRFGGLAAGHDLFLVLRDMAGEDLERAHQAEPRFRYLGNADLTLFLFDPFMVPGFLDLMAGRIEADAARFGSPASEVLPYLLQQIEEGECKLGLVISKFDAVQDLAAVNSPFAPIFANPATMMRRDNTFSHPDASAPEELISRVDYLSQSRLLELEIVSLLRALRESTISAIANTAVREKRVRAVRHFAVSALGETPKHADRLTVRGISPFRVLDPLLWEFSERGYF